MIRLITGLPGSGKTLRMIKYIREALEEGRPVFVHGVDGLNIPGVLPLDSPNAWLETPDGSMIVCDEIQNTWPTRRSGDPIPPVKALNTHRHTGHDFILATQHVAMIDKWARDQVGSHEHLVRRFGLAASDLYRWNEVQEDVKSERARMISDTSLWPHPKKLYGDYKSASIHTVKVSLPKKLFMYTGILLIAGWLIYTALGGLFAMTNPDDSTVAEATSPGGLPPADVATPRTGRAEASDNLSWIEKQLPTAAGIPVSAPMYDDMEPQTYPRLYCVIVGHTSSESSRCSCITQQGTKARIQGNLCRRIALDGLFDPYKADATGSGAINRRDDAEHSQRASQRSRAARSSIFTVPTAKPVYTPPQLVPQPTLYGEG